MSHGAAHTFASVSSTATPPRPEILRGWIKTTRDAMLVFEATRVGIVPRVTRRFHELEKRSIIRSGAIFVFTEEESGIKRWTDPYLWSASRMQGNFLMYRERDDERSSQTDSPYHCSAMTPPTSGSESLDLELEHYILGSWNKGKGLKQNGLMKKTISMSIEGTVYHLISYYYPSDVRSGVLQTPSYMPDLAPLEISPAVLLSFSQVRQPAAPGKPKRGRPPRSHTVQLERPTGLLLSIPSVPSAGETTPNHEWYSPPTPGDIFASASCPPPRSLPLVEYTGKYAFSRPSSSPPSNVHPYHPHHHSNSNARGCSSSSMVYVPMPDVSDVHVWNGQAELSWSHTSSSGHVSAYPLPVYDGDYNHVTRPHNSVDSVQTAEEPGHDAEPSEPYAHSHHVHYTQDVVIPATQAYYSAGPLYH